MNVKQGSFVPSEFVVPLALATEQFRLEPLGPQHNHSDYEAWSSSVEHIHLTPGWETSSWPDDRSLEDNLRDLERHADDFENRAGFTYTVLDPTTDDVIGCVYIYPDTDLRFVNDTDHWLASPKREEFFGPLGVTNIRTFVDPTNRTRVGVLMDVPNMDAVMAAMETAEAGDAMAHDGVLPETLVLLVEA